MRVATLILGGPTALSGLEASAPPEAVLDVPTPTLSLTPGPQNQNQYVHKILRGLTCTSKFEKYCFGIIDDFLAAHKRSMERLLNVQLLPQRF